MDGTKEVISEEPKPSSRTMPLVKWNPSFAIGVSRAVYSGITQVGTGVKKSFTKEEPPVETSGSQQQGKSDTDIMNEVLYEFVENWEGEEPPSPLLFDPDGDFIILPRPTEEVPIDESWASSSATPPPYVYIHSGLLTSLQTVTAYPQNIQKYLKEHLHFPSSKKNLDKGDVSSSNISSNAADGVSGETSSTRESNGQEVRREEDEQENLAVKKQEEEVINSGDPPVTDVLADSVEGQVPKPQRSPRRFNLPSIQSPLALRRRLNQPDQDADRGREAPLTEPKRKEGHASDQTEGLSTSHSVEKEVVVTIPEGTSVLQIPIEPSEGQVLIPKPVQKHLSWNPIRSRFSFRPPSEGGSDHETCLTEECEIDDKKDIQPLQSDEGGEVISVSQETQVVQNPDTISEGEEVLEPSFSQKYFNRLPVKTPFSFRKSTTSNSGTDTGQETSASSSEVYRKDKTPTQSGQADVASDSLNAGETQKRQTSVSLSEGVVTVPSSAPKYLSWIPVKSPFRPGRPLSSDVSTKLGTEALTIEVVGKEKAHENSEETQLSQVPPLDHFENDDLVPTSSPRLLRRIQNRSPFKFRGPPASFSEIREEAPTGEIDVKEEPVVNSEETQVVQIPVDFSEGQILVPHSAQTHLRWVPARFPFAFSSNLGSETGNESKGVDSCETGEKEVPILSEESTTLVSQEDGQEDVTDNTLKESSPSLGYWRQFPVQWLSPEKYRLLVANTIIRRKEDLEILCASAHLLESEHLVPENMDIDFDELKKIFSTIKTLNSIQTSKAGTWSFSPIIPTLYRRYWRVPLEGTSERQEQSFRRSSFSCTLQEPREPLSPLEESNNSENTNFGEIHELFKQFSISKDSLGVASRTEMASPKGGEKTSGRGFLHSFKNIVWTRENLHLDEKIENPPVAPSGNEERIDIAPSEKSQERVSQLYQPKQDKNRLTKEWTNAREDLENFVVTETRSLSGGLDFRTPDEQSKYRVDTFSSYFTSPFVSRKCYICNESLSSMGFFMWKRQEYQCKQCKHLFCKKCQISSLQGGECMVCRQDISRQKEEVSSLGISRSYTDAFKHFRNEFNKVGWDVERHQEQFRFQPTIGSVLRQCRRLEHGYKKCLDDKIDPNKMLGGGLLKRGIPDWQKPPTWIEAGTKEVRGCQLCSRERFVDSLHNCRLCGRRVCSQDSSRDFMLYIPDQNTIEYSPKMNVCWKIIRVVGCPSVEPVVNLYMRICFTCKSMLVAHQEKSFTLSYITVSADYRKCEQTILDIHQETQKMKENIQSQLPQFVKMVDTFSADSKNIPESLMKSLVKHQDDLMDQFPRYIIAVDKLREMFPQTEQQIKLIRSLMQEIRSFYRDNVIIYRVAGRQLSEIMPKEEIEHRMITVNTDAINCACIVISQLAFEILKICIQYKIPEKLAMAIREVSEICEDDLKKMIEQKGKTDKDETWDNHKKSLDEFIKAEMKSERRYLKVEASRQTQDDLQIFLKKESHRRIRSTLIQLKAKSASRAFTGTKEALETLQKATQNENLMI
ncbi:hypothetical protein HOLleu_27835 [Holothuria leucospilota]|uniref:RING-type domain-containing protein n=1 Tax=Holothuria leucospilota TaxID=206669 RepID=A0A9Q1BQG7_HOLLE|nr:hypothetical protein HOLleu_27835 [Holothuria leucospilota]